MKIRRTQPPVASPIPLKAMAGGLSGMVFGRRATGRLASGLKEYYGVEHAWLTSSGKAALLLILKALKTLRPERTRVVIPAYTCYSVPSAVVKAGLEVVPSDIDPGTLDFDMVLLERAVDEKTLCVVPNHLFGMAADVRAVKEAARGAGAFVVEDAAQAMGVSANGEKLGTLGDAGFLSLGRGKNISAGSGGVIMTGSPEIAGAIEEFYSLIDAPGPAKAVKGLLEAAATSLLMRPSLYWLPAGLPFLRLGETIFYRDFPVKRLSGMRAGLMKGWAERLEALNRGRAERAGYLIGRLKGGPFREVPSPYLRLPVLAPDRDTRDRVFVETRALGASLMYPTAVNGIEELKGLLRGRSYPGAESVAERLLALPTHCLLTQEEMDEIVRLVKSMLAPTACAVVGFSGDAREACNND